MLSNGVTGNIGALNGAAKADREIDYAPIEWFDTEKAIIKLVTQSGREIGVKQKSGERLHDGDIIYSDEKIIIAVKIQPSKLIHVKFEDICAAGRVCYELGNRHLPVLINKDGVTVPYDEPTALYLKGLGFKPECIEDVFKGSLVKHHHSHG